ncbi:MAG: phosphotransferase family protein [Solirubrobacterales bacterium]
MPGSPAPPEPEAADVGGDGSPEGINQASLEAWFVANVEGAAPPLTFERLAGGRSNLTYAVTDRAGRRLALRRPPLGPRLGSAHDMGREYRVISALRDTPVPVAPALAMCTDEEVIGAPFYLMEFVDGHVLRSADSAGSFSEAQRAEIGDRVADTLVAVHDVDPDAVGLGELGRKEDYVARTLKRWIGQWEKSKTRELDLVGDVHARLEARIPDQGPAAIVHGDYRLDNMIVAESGEIAAVVDWELCTLGDPLADIGLLLVYWSDPGDELVPLVETPTIAPGFPSREHIRDRYAERSGRDLSQIDFYVALGYWKLAVVLEGVYARYAAGQYGEGQSGYEALGQMVDRLVVAADEAERRLG